MNKLFKFVLWILAAVVLLLLITAVIIPLVIDPNDYKDEIANQVHNQTGRELRIEGDIDLSFSLPLSVHLDLGRVSLSNAEGFGDTPFATMENASVFAAIWPLLTQNQLNIGKVKLIGLQLNLMKNAQGKTNWDDLAGKPAAETKDETPTPAKTAESTQTTLPQIAIAGVEIKDATIHWIDQQQQQELTLTKSNINISELIENNPFELKLSTHIKSNNPALSGNIQLTSQPTVSLSKQLFKFADTHLSLDLTGADLPGGENKTQLTANILFDGEKQQLDLSELKLMSYELSLTGQFQASTVDNGLHYQANLNVDTFSPKELAARLGSPLPEMKNPQALTSSNLQFEMTGDQNQIRITNVAANLDQTAMNGTAAITSFNPISYVFDLKLDQLDLDFYAAADSAAPASNVNETKTKDVPAKQAKQTAETKTKPSPEDDPFAALRELNLDGKLTIGQFKTGGAKMTNVIIILKGNDGIIELAPLKADLYGGKLNLQSAINTAKKTPTIKLNSDLSQVQLGNLLKDTTGNNEFTGTANIGADISTAGKNSDQLLKNSNGTARLLISDGHIKSLDIINTLRTAQAIYRGQVPPTKSQQQDTKFTELKGTFKIKNGVVHNNDLYSRSPVMEFSGKGYADLPREYMDYTLNVKFLNSLKIDDKTGGTDYKGEEFPYIIKGKFSDLSQTASVDKVLEHQAKKAIEKKLNKEIEKRFGDKFKDIIKF